MTIKSDRWIIEKAKNGMIEPFEAKQIRTRGEDKVISYGTSSYGYDVRCANDFKVFTNIHSATVDPKAFSENSFVWTCLGKLVSSRRILSRSPVPSNTSEFRRTF